MKKTIIIFLIFLIIATVVNTYGEEGKYVYYGAIPPLVYADLFIVGFSDNTHVKLLNVSDPSNIKLLKEISINNGELMILYSYTNFNTTNVFKVVSDKRIGVYIGGKEIGMTLYPSKQGGLIGNEFYLINRIPSKYGSYMTVLTYEDSEIKFYDDRGKLLIHATIPQYRFLRLNKIPQKPYRLSSTGRAVVVSGAEDAFAYLVDERGRLIGERFIGGVFSSMSKDTLVIVIPYEQCTVKIHDLKHNKLAEHTFTQSDVLTGRYWLYRFNRKPLEFLVESNRPITVMAGAASPGENELNNFADDTASLTIPANITFNFLLVDFAFIFTDKPTMVGVGTSIIKLRENEHIIIGVAGNGFEKYLHDPYAYIVSVPRQGIVQLESSQPITLQLYVGRSYDNWGTYIVSLQDSNIDLGPPKPGGKIKEEIITSKKGFPIEYIVTVLVIVLISIVIIVMKIRRK